LIFAIAGGDPDSTLNEHWAISGQCQLTIVERGKVRNPFFRFMSRFIFGHGATIENYLSSLAKSFGEKAALK